MKLKIVTIIIAVSAFITGCSSARSANTAASKPADTKPATTNVGGASEIVKTIYQNAIKRDCAAIPSMLTEEFKKAVGTGKDGLDALCDSLTDSGKVTAVTVTGEEMKGDSATVKVQHTLKDGKTENKEERMKKAGDKWLMDS